MLVAAPAIPLKPKTPAIIAITKNVTAQLIIPFSFNFTLIYGVVRQYKYL